MNTLNLKQLIREEVKRALKEARVPFKGSTPRDFYDIVKKMKMPQVFANGNFYFVDLEDLKDQVLTAVRSPSEFVYLTDRDGDIVAIKISDIEFIESV